MGCCLHRSSEVPGVFGADSEGTEDGVRRGHPRRPLPSARQEEREEVYGVLKKRTPPPHAHTRTECGVSHFNTQSSY